MPEEPEATDGITGVEQSFLWGNPGEGSDLHLFREGSMDLQVLRHIMFPEVLIAPAAIQLVPASAIQRDFRTIALV